MSLKLGIMFVCNKKKTHYIDHDSQACHFELLLSVQRGGLEFYCWEGQGSDLWKNCVHN
jgi:hypothetical protein